ncbi:hypothetical protein [Streptosporangium sp. NPDC020145]|uniref:hypothetical protein n=1 Tax=Streptosporangium sp. NPDC020145 TaxID=3154694 RepID=UPI003424BE97
MATLCIYALVGADLAPITVTRAIALTPDIGPRATVAVIVGCILLWPLAPGLILLSRRWR